MKKGPGITYNVEDANINVPVLDVDNTDIMTVVIEVKRLQHMFGLSDGEIYRSSEGKDSWHVYFFKNPKVTWEKVVEIAEECTLTDDDYLEHIKANREARMRVEAEHARTVPSKVTGMDDYGEFLKNMHDRVILGG